MNKLIEKIIAEKAELQADFDALKTEYDALYEEYITLKRDHDDYMAM